MAKTADEAATIETLDIDFLESLTLLFGDVDLSEFDLPENPDDYVAIEQEAGTEPALA